MLLYFKSSDICSNYELQLVNEPHNRVQGSFKQLIMRAFSCTCHVYYDVPKVTRHTTCILAHNFAKSQQHYAHVHIFYFRHIYLKCTQVITYAIIFDFLDIFFYRAATMKICSHLLTMITTSLYAHNISYTHIV